MEKGLLFEAEFSLFPWSTKHRAMELLGRRRGSSWKWFLLGWESKAQLQG